jgi:hypothetical protein
MSTDFRDALQELHTSIQLYTGQNPAAADVHPAELTRRLMDAMAASAAALSQSESAPTVKEPLTAPTGSLVESVKRRMIKGLRGTWEETSCDVLFEVATWFRTERDSPETAAVLEQEASR